MHSNVPKEGVRTVGEPSEAQALTSSGQTDDVAQSRDNHMQNIEVSEKQKDEAQENPKSTLPTLEAATRVSVFGDGADEREEAVKGSSHSVASSLQSINGSLQGGKASNKKKRRRKRGNNGK